MKDRFVVSDETIRQMEKLMGSDPVMEGGTEAANAVPRVEGGNVVIGETTLVKPRSVVERLVCLTLAYSVLNLHFPRKSNAFLTFVHLYLLGIDDGSRVPLKALSFRQQTTAMLG